LQPSTATREDFPVEVASAATDAFFRLLRDGRLLSPRHVVLPFGHALNDRTFPVQAELHEIGLRREDRRGGAAIAVAR
jgi:hypothetical protein